VKVSLQERVRHRLKQLTDDGRVPQERLGKFVGLSRSYMGRILNADAAISLELIEKCCEFFQITAAELVVEPGSLIQPITPIEASVLDRFRKMTELERHSWMIIMDGRNAGPVQNRRARIGHKELTEEQQLVVDLYARSNEQARSGILKVLRGAASAAKRVQGTTE
jgi:transcriptional regulator with XRE-family HTH domain